MPIRHKPIAALCIGPRAGPARPLRPRSLPRWRRSVKPAGPVLLASVLVAFASIPAQAEWPARPIRAIVPVGAGSTTDIVPRAVFEQLSAQLGQPIVVDNRAGAGTTIGANLVAKAE